MAAMLLQCSFIGSFIAISNSTNKFSDFDIAHTPKKEIIAESKEKRCAESKILGTTGMWSFTPLNIQPETPG